MHAAASLITSLQQLAASPLSPATSSKAAQHSRAPFQSSHPHGRNPHAVHAGSTHLLRLQQLASTADWSNSRHISQARAPQSVLPDTCTSASQTASTHRSQPAHRMGFHTASCGSVSQAVPSHVPKPARSCHAGPSPEPHTALSPLPHTLISPASPTALGPAHQTALSPTAHKGISPIFQRTLNPAFSTTHTSHNTRRSKLAANTALPRSDAYMQNGNTAPPCSSDSTRCVSSSQHAGTSAAHEAGPWQHDASSTSSNCPAPSATAMQEASPFTCSTSNSTASDSAVLAMDRTHAQIRRPRDIAVTGDGVFSGQTVRQPVALRNANTPFEKATGDAEGDLQVIGDFCSRTVSKHWLRNSLHTWHAAARLQVKWRSISQVRHLSAIYDKLINDMMLNCKTCRYPLS